MKAIGDYAIIELENSVSSTGIQVKTDGRGLVLSCPKYPEIEGKSIVFDTNQTYAEVSGYMIMHSSFIMAVIE